MQYWSQQIRRFSFGADLRLTEETFVEEMPEPDIKCIAEEGLETLMMLNLDQLFPNQGHRGQDCRQHDPGDHPTENQ